MATAQPGDDAISRRPIQPNFRANPRHWPLLAAALIIFLVNGYQLALQLSQPGPITSWEGSLAVEAWRVVQGLPIYEDPAVGHATHQYGPLSHLLLAFGFYLTGPNLWLGPYLSLTSSILLVVILAYTVRPNPSWMWFIVSAALFFGINLPTRNYFVFTRPDMHAALAGTASVLSAYHWVRTRRLGWLIASGLLLLIGTLFKQPTLQAGLIPPLALILSRPLPRFTRLAASCVPLVFTVVALWAYAVWWPLGFAPAFIFPSKFPFTFLLWSMPGVRPMLAAVVIPVAFGALCFSRSDQRSAWTLAALCVTAVCAGIVGCKWGADTNTFIPFFLSAYAFAVLHAGSLAERNLLSSVVAMVVIASTSLTGALVQWTPLHHASPDYDHVVDVAAQLSRAGNTRVSCPLDPSITLLANGTAPDSERFYRDWVAAMEGGRDDVLPRNITCRLTDADYFISVHDTDFSGGIPDHQLRTLGFLESATLHVPGYTIWQRARPELWRSACEIAAPALK